MFNRIRYSVTEASVRVTVWLLLADTYVVRRWPWAFGFVSRLFAIVGVLRKLWAVSVAIRALLWVLDHVNVLM